MYRNFCLCCIWLSIAGGACHGSCVSRGEATSAMTCAGISGNAQTRVLHSSTGDALDGRGSDTKSEDNMVSVSVSSKVEGREYV
jgi:hypothetical protein